MGLATGWALKRRGHEPVVYEQFKVGNPHGSSHGRSRIFRLASAEPEYVRLAREAFGLWRELEAESGETILELNGLVEVVRSLEESTAETLEACGGAWEGLHRGGGGVGAARPRGGGAALPDPRPGGRIRRRPAGGRHRARRPRLEGLCPGPRRAREHARSP